jgi:hypothetical protein
MLVLLIAISIFVNLFYIKKSFLNFDEINDGIYTDDGFSSQIMHVKYFLANDFDASAYGDASFVLFVHMSRYVFAYAFEVASLSFGMAAQTVLIYSIIGYSISTLSKHVKAPLILYCFLILPLVASWRTVIVMISVVYYLNFIVSSRVAARKFDLFFAVLASSLSSASLIFLFFSITYHMKKRLYKLNIFNVMIYLYLSAMSLIVVWIKINGFAEAGKGYDSVETDNPLLSMIYRSTFIVKFTYADAVTQVLYMLLLLIVLVLVVQTIFAKQRSKLDVLFLFSLFGLAVEGLGAAIMASIVILKMSGFEVER